VKKRSLLEYVGRIGLGGINSDGPHYNRYKTKHPTGYHTGGYQGNADSQISQRHALVSTLDEEKEEYKEDPDMLEEEGLMEFFARIIKMPLTESDKKDIEEMHCHCDEVARNEASHCPIHGENRDVDEASTVASLGGGPATRLGTNAKGVEPSSEETKKRLKAANIYKN
jgi:hypothetical protein